MRAETYLRRTGWTLLDQGLVSIGTFLLNIALARHLAPAEYGVFALLVGALLLAQVVSSSLIFYPMSIRAAVATPQERARLIARSLLLLGGLVLPLALAIAIVLAMMGRLSLALPLLGYFAAWQGQEALRRSLFAEFRHRDAIVSDSICYLGPLALVLLVTGEGPMTLEAVFLCLLLSSALALCVSAWQVRLDFRAIEGLRATMAAFWSLGGWSLANNLTGASRIQIALWGLTALHGPAATASFQAALNLVSLANPVLLGLCNVIPQTAAQRFSEGYGSAWRAARVYVLFGAVPIMLCYGALLLLPGFALGLLYGTQSVYAGLVVPVRILAVGWLLGYAADMVCSYMHGVDAARLALFINAVGALSAAALFLPLSLTHGIAGACTALAISSLARLLASQWLLSRMIAHDSRPAH